MRQRRYQPPLKAEEDLAGRDLAGRETGGTDLGGVGPLLEGARPARADTGGSSQVKMLLTSLWLVAGNTNMSIFEGILATLSWQ